MLNSIAFATSLAIISGALYFVLYILAVVWPSGFRFFFNAPKPLTLTSDVDPEEAFRM